MYQKKARSSRRKGEDPKRMIKNHLPPKENIKEAGRKNSIKKLLNKTAANQIYSEVGPYSRDKIPQTMTKTKKQSVFTKKKGGGRVLNSQRYPNYKFPRMSRKKEAGRKSKEREDDRLKASKQKDLSRLRVSVL